MTPEGTVADRIAINVWDEDQLLPDIAWDGEDFLVCWADRRHSIDQVYCTRVLGNGTVPDPVGLRLPCQDDTLFQTAPVIASNGTNHLLAWLSLRARGTVVQAVRLGLEGSPLDSVPLDLTPDSLFDDWVAVGCDGEDYLVAWSGQEPNGIGQDLSCIRIGSNGLPLDSAPTLVCRTPGGLSEPALAFLHDRWLVTWTDMRDRFDIYAARIGRDGNVLDPGGFPVCISDEVQREPDVAADSSRFIVVWSGFGPRDGFDIWAAAVDTSGTVGVAHPVPQPRPPGIRLRVRPNPARGPVTFESDPPAGRVEIRDASGRLVTVLDAGRRVWNRRDARGIIVGDGVYVARAGSSSRRFVILE